MSHCRDGHSSDIVDAVDDIGTPDVVSEGENFPPDVTKSVIARPEIATIGIGIKFGIEGLAVF